jgi:hypothetical protein
LLENFFLNLKRLQEKLQFLQSYSNMRFLYFYFYFDHFGLSASGSEFPIRSADPIESGLDPYPKHCFNNIVVNIHFIRNSEAFEELSPHIYCTCIVYRYLLTVKCIEIEKRQNSLLKNENLKTKRFDSKLAKFCRS